MEMKYSLAYLYQKKGNLAPWYMTQQAAKGNYSKQVPKYYMVEREINLVVFVRYENHHCYCCVKCPVNPLPIKGEFEAFSLAELSRFLKTLGWDFKEKIDFSSILSEEQFKERENNRHENFTDKEN